MKSYIAFLLATCYLMVGNIEVTTIVQTNFELGRCDAWRQYPHIRVLGKPPFEGKRPPRTKTTHGHDVYIDRGDCAER